MTRRKTALALSWLPSLACMAMLFYASSLPGDAIHLPEFRFSDKVVHFLAYALLGGLLATRMELRRKLGGFRPGYAGGAGRDFLGTAAGVLFGISDEIHQLFVPLREFGFGDMAADGLGVMTAFWVFGRWQESRRVGSRVN